MPDRSPAEQLVDWLYAETNGVVQSGPFKGMTLLREFAWPDTALAPLLLGTYEMELHEFIEQELSFLMRLDNPKVVNVGCAEGYYAVGLARRLPKATVFVVEPNKDSLRIAHETARLNCVRLIDSDDMPSVEADFIVMDCERSESLYLDPAKYPALRKAAIVVEIHGDEPGEDIFNQFKDSHSITMIIEGPRNPNLFPILLRKSSIIRWACMNENRPCTMVWFVMRPK